MAAPRRLLPLAPNPFYDERHHNKVLLVLFWVTEVHPVVGHPGRTREATEFGLREQFLDAISLTFGNLLRIPKDDLLALFAEHPKQAGGSRGKRRIDYERCSSFLPLPDPVQPVPHPSRDQARESEHDERRAKAETEPAS